MVLTVYHYNARELFYYVGGVNILNYALKQEFYPVKVGESGLSYGNLEEFLIPFSIFLLLFHKFRRILEFF
jgi:hypothetical protein